MVIHLCEICKKVFNKKSTYINHIKNKKKPCKTIEQEKIENNKIQHQMTPEQHQMTPSNQHNDINIIKKREKNYICNFCNEHFCRSYVLKKHLDRCKIRKEKLRDKEEIYQELLKKMEIYEKNNENQNNLIKELNNKINILEKKQGIIKNKIKNNTINNGIINNNIIVGFGRENLKNIDNKEL